MRWFLNKCLVSFSFIHKVCPLCAFSRRYPRLRFAKIVSAWSRICPCCNIYYLAKKRKLI